MYSNLPHQLYVSADLMFISQNHMGEKKALAGIRRKKKAITN